MKKNFKKKAIIYPLGIYFLLSVYFTYRLFLVFGMSILSIFTKQSVFDNWIEKIDKDLSKYGIN